MVKVVEVADVAVVVAVEVAVAIARARGYCDAGE